MSRRDNNRTEGVASVRADALMHECRCVDESFLIDAPTRATAERELAVSPAQLFACFEDNTAWRQWVPVIRQATWTSPLTAMPGCTRTVEIIGGVRLDEVFWAWRPEQRIGFRVTASSTRAIAALLECFDVTPLGKQRCALRWRMAAELRGPVGFVQAGIRAVLAPSMQRMMAQLERVAARYPSVEETSAGSRWHGSGGCNDSGARPDVE
jgi:Polyketide cyclase / dehydrase and lipid transport